jgi:hypothetical protein
VKSISVLPIYAAFLNASKYVHTHHPVSNTPLARRDCAPFCAPLEWEMEEWLERLELFERLRTAISKGFEGRPAFSVVYIFCNNRPFKAAAGVQIPLGKPMKIEGQVCNPYFIGIFCLITSQ